MSGPGDHQRVTERVAVRDDRVGERRLFVRILIIQCVAIVALVVSIWATNYQSRVNLVDAVRAECERGKLDRSANAQGWRIAQDAREADRQPDVAARYDGLARGLEQRARVDCRKAYPTPKLLEFR